MLQITSFTVEYRAHALGIDEEKPRFSWVLGSDRQNTFQSSYTLTVKAGDTPVFTGTGGSESVLVEYAGEALKPRTVYTAELVVTDNYGNTASAETSFETGVMGEMKGEFIGHDFGDVASWSSLSTASGWGRTTTPRAGRAIPTACNTKRTMSPPSFMRAKTPSPRSSARGGIRASWAISTPKTTTAKKTPSFWRSPSRWKTAPSSSSRPIDRGRQRRVLSASPNFRTANSSTRPSKPKRASPSKLSPIRRRTFWRRSTSPSASPNASRANSSS